MAGVTVVKFSSERFRKETLSKLIIAITRKLEKYAADQLNEMAKSHEFQNRTFNLQDSFVWGVFYKGELRKYGFYGAGRATINSQLHEYGSMPIDLPMGRDMATQFITTFRPSDGYVASTGSNTWVVVWAACIPYGAYLEGGFTSKGKGVRFRVISQCYDQIRSSFGDKARFTFDVNYPTY